MGLLLASAVGPAVAGPPYQSDDPQPTDFGHFEIYTFDKGTFGHSGSSSASGLDFNYGAVPDLQLTAAVPFGYDAPSDGPSAFGPGNVELAAKYKIIHQDTFGLDVSVFPRIFLPSSSQTGDPNASILLPIWVQKDWGPVSAFGGGASTAPPSPVRSWKRFSWVSRSFIRPQMKMGLALRPPWDSARDMISTTITTCWAMSRAAWKTSLKPEVGRGTRRSCSPISQAWLAFGASMRRRSYPPARRACAFPPCTGSHLISHFRLPFD